MSNNNLIGFKKDMLTIQNTMTINGRKMVNVVCECGNQKLMRLDTFNHPKVYSCGCYKREKHKNDITGRKFGMLTAMRRLNKYANGTYAWEFECDCGRRKAIRSDHVVSGKTKSCGCQNKESAKKVLNLSDCM